MKNVTFLSVAFFLILGCSTNPQKRVEHSVKNYLKASLKNPKTYVPINFSKVDTITQADTILQYLKLVDLFIDLEKETQQRIEIYREIRWELSTSNKEAETNMKKSKTIIDSLESIKTVLSDLALKSEVKNNLVYYKVSHEYSHNSIDNEIVNLTLDFFLNPEFKILPDKLEKGINGQANFKIKIISKDGGTYYTEFVVDPKLDGQIINSAGSTELTLKAGKHYLTWTASNKNGFGILTNPETFREELVLEDSKQTETIFVILGKNFFSYKNEEDAVNDNFYQEYIINK